MALDFDQAHYNGWSNGGSSGSRPLPSPHGPKFSQFYAVYFLEKWCWCPWKVGGPSYREFWICPLHYHKAIRRHQPKVSVASQNRWALVREKGWRDMPSIIVWKLYSVVLEHWSGALQWSHFARSGFCVEECLIIVTLHYPPHGHMRHCLVQ